MYLTKISIPPTRLRRLRLYDGYGVHRMVYDMFPSGRREGRFLYREYTDTRQNRHIIIVSEEIPRIPENCRVSFSRATTMEIPPEYLGNKRYRFNIRTNPVKFCKATRKRLSLLEEDQQRAWMIARGTANGFRVLEETLYISDTGVERLKKRKGEEEPTITLNSVVFNGILEVEDREKFTEAFRKGIGKGKGFGFGLLQLEPLPE